MGVKRGSIAKPGYTHVADYLGAIDGVSGGADGLFEWLLEKTSWRTERLQMFGREVLVPRLVAWYGDPGVTYRYSGIEHCAGGWPSALLPLVESIRSEFAPGVNFLLLNRYRNGADAMGWHTDDEPELADPVVSISLGATRRFHLRAQAGAETLSLDLGHGALLVHGRHWPHAVPRTRKAVGERINLSFRTVVAR
ncbi:MAG: alpha-ketoglutarate-dependent dioxygenase AlkB [Gammaproteobacteria bacterium]|nr:alpha-ketoglutarate-dependent dioxygenase AlkB [Gammaproteobacteria bacterium]